MAISLVSLAFKAQIPPTQRFVLVAICDFANDIGECFPSLDAISDKTGLCERAVRGAVSYLEKAGLLTREMRSGRSTLYTVNPGTWCPPAANAPLHQMPHTPAAGAGGAAPHAPITVTQPSRNQKTKTPVVPKVPGAGKDHPGFDVFWQAYPRKEAKQRGLREWNKLKPDQDMQAQIVRAVEYQASTDDWTKDDGKFVPNAARYLEERRWERVNPAKAPAVKRFMPDDKQPNYWTPVGFETIWEAENAGCFPGNAHLFREGKRIPARSAA